MLLSLFIFVASIVIILFNIKRSIKYNVYVDNIINFSLLLLGYATFVLVSKLFFIYNLKNYLIYAPGIGFLIASFILVLLVFPLLHNLKLKLKFNYKLFTFISIFALIVGLFIKFYILINFGLILLSYDLLWIILKILRKEKND